MFETANLPQSGRTARAAMIAVSTSIQVAAAIGAMLYPLLHIEPLPKAPARRAQLQGVVVELAPVRARASSAMSAPAIPRDRLLALVEAPRAVPAGQPAMFDEAPSIEFAASGSGVGQGPALPCVGDCVPVAIAPPVRPVPVRPAEPGPAAAVPKGPVVVGGDVKAPRLTAGVQPVYPPLARQARIEGTVRIQAVITRDGMVRSLRLVSGHPLLAPAAMEAVRQWRYEATRLNGVAVEVILQVDVHFTLAR
ncbi:MAG: energy transducer TonB [Bryobacteraceae bacterium]